MQVTHSLTQCCFSAPPAPFACGHPLQLPCPPALRMWVAILLSTNMLPQRGLRSLPLSTGSHPGASKPDHPAWAAIALRRFYGDSVPKLPDGSEAPLTYLSSRQVQLPPPADPSVLHSQTCLCPSSRPFKTWPPSMHLSPRPTRTASGLCSEDHTPVTSFPPS